jgi:hypothetical protein
MAIVIHVSDWLCIYVNIYIYMHTYKFTYIYIHTFTSICINTYIYGVLLLKTAKRYKHVTVAMDMVIHVSDFVIENIP